MNRQTLSAILAAATLAGTAAAQWGFVTPSNPPSPRTEPLMAYDFLAQRTVLFGGTGQTDTWTYDGSAWRQETPASSPRMARRARMVYDLSRGVTVLYGGGSITPTNGMATDETWEWNGLDWRQVSTSFTPGGLADHAMAFDLNRQRVVAYGGRPNTWTPMAQTNTFEYHGTNWQSVTTVNNPGPLEHHAMSFHLPTGLVVLFGGVDPASGMGTDDTWTYDGLTWTQLNQTGPRPPARIDPGMAYDYTRQVVLMFGGQDPNTLAIHNDTWEFDGTRWNQVTGVTAGIYPPRSLFGMSMDTARSRIVLFGGRIANLSVRSDTWEHGAQFSTYGFGCPGSNGVPTLSSAGWPRFGTTFPVQLGNLDPNSSFALMATGFSNATWAFGALPANLTSFGLTNCRLYTSAELIELVPASGGTANWSWSVPNSLRLVGTTFYQQGGSLDPSANPAGIALSNAGAAVIGY